VAAEAFNVQSSTFKEGDDLDAPLNFEPGTLNSSSGAGRAAAGPQRFSLAAGLPAPELSLLDLADRLLDRGVVLAGEATLSVAGVDLVYLGLNAVLSSVETLQRVAPEGSPGPRGVPPAAGGFSSSAERRAVNDPASVEHSTLKGASGGRPATSRLQPASLHSSRGLEPPAVAGPSANLPMQLGGLPPSGASAWSATAIETADAEVGEVAETAEAAVERLRGVLPDRVDVDPEGVEQGLAKLVLTLVEFIRQLLERQAIRRMEGGRLTDEQVERMGLALERLEAKMGDLCHVFGIEPEDLNINLGPLGDLI